MSLTTGRTTQLLPSVPPITSSPDVELAYRSCVRTTRHAAANFYYGISLLPRPKRWAMSAVYAFSRRIDDIGDGPLADEVKLAALAAEREHLELLSLGKVDPGDPVLIALGDAHPRFDLPLDALASLIDGVELDVRGTSYETFDELVVYCRHVAGSIGRLCLAIFGAGDRERANPLADDLGVAMQLTNILRDVREDEECGRIYLPAEDLRRFGIDDPATASPEALAGLIRFEAARNREWFARGLVLADLLDARSSSCLLAMTGIYRGILERIERQPAEVLQRRISVPAWEKAWLAARSLAGVRA
ncbi:MAG TPA: presqualene diphosphate synthase HpnD [Solirubrobacteraceae bacterium]|nr:presqualene diphosphate synthase HpnD [Solirubrobacteraceae bacterium]